MVRRKNKKKPNKKNVHDSLVDIVEEHAQFYQWKKQDIPYSFRHRGHKYDGQIDFFVYKNPNFVVLYEIKSNWRESTENKAREQLDRAELMLRTVQNIEGYYVSPDARIRKVYVARNHVAFL